LLFASELDRGLLRKLVVGDLLLFARLPGVVFHDEADALERRLLTSAY
jgi:hypothetical protein